MHSGEPKTGSPTPSCRILVKVNREKHITLIQQEVNTDAPLNLCCGSNIPFIPHFTSSLFPYGLHSVHIHTNPYGSDLDTICSEGEMKV